MMLVEIQRVISKVQPLIGTDARTVYSRIQSIAKEVIHRCQNFSYHRELRGFCLGCAVCLLWRVVSGYFSTSIHPSNKPSKENDPPLKIVERAEGQGSLSATEPKTGLLSLAHPSTSLTVGASKTSDELLHVLKEWNPGGGKMLATKKVEECFKENAPVLNLRGLSISSLPENILNKLPWLKELNLSCNSITCLDISMLTELEVFDGSVNRLTTLVIGSHLTKLRAVNLQKNQCKELPCELLMSPSLKILNLSENQISSLFPPEGTTSLVAINLSSNPIDKASKDSWEIYKMRVTGCTLFIGDQVPVDWSTKWTELSSSKGS